MIHIMRGIPGSGKSTYVKGVGPLARGDVVSADDYFETDAGYVFDPHKIGDAHASCLRRFSAYIYRWAAEHNGYRGQRGMPDMWVDNTNIRAWEIAPYVALASAYGHSVEIVEVRCDFEVARKRQTHNVPEYLLAMMYGDMRREQLPPHWTVRVVEV